MRRMQIGSLDVSRICLGTMTWGEQNSQTEAFAQMEYALASGVNFWDTAEMYPVPPKAETYTATECIIGNWFQKSGRRKDVVLATKVIGHSAGHPWVREGKDNGLRKASILRACEDSLKRLRTDYIDLYQFHWPDRSTNFFGKLGYEIGGHDYWTPLEESLSAVAELIQAGKIRHFGVSNETPWGLMKYRWLAKELGLPAPVSIQNPCSLLNRSAEVGLAEVCHREQIAFLAYSPLGFGMLTGKYSEGNSKASDRLQLFSNHFKRYSGNQAHAASADYAKLARALGLTPVQLALGFLLRQPWITSVIIGATNLEQLKENIECHNLALGPEAMEGIADIHSKYPNPAP